MSADKPIVSIFGNLDLKNSKLYGNSAFSLPITPYLKSNEVNRIITSVGIYIGNGEFIHSSSSKGVTISDIDDPYY